MRTRKVGYDPSMPKPVAVQGEIKATPGTIPFPPANTGSWRAEPVKEVIHSTLKVKGKPVVLEATCTFTFSGFSSTGATVTGSEEVKLSPTTKVLLKSSTFVLVDGDMQIGQFGNQLATAPTGHLSTD